MTPKNYDVEFVENTIKLLTTNYEHIEKQDLEVTFLINCLTGLIIATNEKIQKSQKTIFKYKVSDPRIRLKIPPHSRNINFKEGIKNTVNDLNLLEIDEQEIQENVEFELTDCTDMMLIDYLGKIRNGIAHQNIDTIDNQGKWHGIKLWNNTTNGIKNFETKFTVHELKEFALFIAEEYIKI